MCLPLAGVGLAAGAGGLGSVMGIAQIGLGIMGAMASHQAQMAQYKEQVRFRMEQAKQAQKTLNQQVAQQQAALSSEVGKAQGAIAEASIDAYAAKSKAAAAAAESGIVGLSVDHLLAGVDGKKGRYENRIRYNAEMGAFNAENELKMAQRGAEARVASIPIPTKPSFAPTLVSIGSSIVQGVGTMHKYGSFGGASAYSNPYNAHHVMPV